MWPLPFAGNSEAHWQRQQEQQRVEENRQAAENLLKHANRLTPGMSEDEVARIVGPDNWRGQFGTGGVSNPQDIFTLDASRFLVLDWEFQDVPKDTSNRRMYLDPARNQVMVKILKTCRVSDHPY